MKNIYKFISLLMVMSVTLSSCHKDDDVMTENAKEGGMVLPIANVPYKLNNTPVVSVELIIPRGPGITKVIVEKYFMTTDANGDPKVSGTVVAKEVLVNGDNANVPNDGTSSLDATFTQTYAELISGLELDGSGLPADENDLTIGDVFVFSYTSVMEDGREVLNGGTTNIAIANKYAGNYKSTVLYYHPSVGYDTPNSTDIEDRDVSAVTADVSQSGFAVWTDNWMKFEIDPLTNLVVNFEVQDTWDYDVRLAVPNVDPTITDDMVSRYDPETKTIYLYYAYDGSANTYGTTRVFHHTMVLN